MMVLNKQWEIWFRNKSKYFMNIGRWMPLYVEYIMQNVGLDETQARIKTAGRNINNLRYADDTTLMAESEEELKSLKEPLDESERGEWKSWLKTQHLKN